MKKLILIRHGKTYANSYLENNKWGSENFTDNPSLIDTPLNTLGINQSIKLKQTLKNILNNIPSTSKVHVLVSPLTRTLQTFKNSNIFDEHIPCKALSELRERTYLISDVGRKKSILEHEYNFLNFDECEEIWWENEEIDYVEWRPNHFNQVYINKGEMLECFRKRLYRLLDFIDGRDEEYLFCYTSWGVIRGLTGREDVGNCEVLEIDYDRDDIEGFIEGIEC